MATLLEHTVMPSGGDYTSLDAAVDHIVASHANLVTADVYAEIKIDGTWSSADTAKVTIGAITTNATCYLKIYTTAASRHAGIWSTNKYILSMAEDSPFQMDGVCNDLWIDGLQIRQITPTNSLRAAILLRTNLANGANAIWVSNCILRGDSNQTYNQVGLKPAANYVTVKAWNTIIYDIYPVGVTSCGVHSIDWTGTNITLYSCTVIGGYYAIRQTGDTNGKVTCKNCYAGGSSNGDFWDDAGTLGQTNCASADATAGGTNHTHAAVDTDTFVNVTAGSEDFHLAADGLSPLQAAGVDTTGDAAPLNFTVDIDGDTRDATWDIGADAFVVAGVAWIPKVIMVM